MLESDGVKGEHGVNVLMKLINSENHCSMKGQRDQICCPKGQCELFRGKNQTEVLRICSSIVPISLFRIDIPSVGQRVRFCAEVPWVEVNNHIKL